MPLFRIEEWPREGLAISVTELTDVTTTGSAGTFGSIWRAGGHGQYAIKSFNDDPDAVDARAEFRLLSSLSETGVVPRAFCMGWFQDPETHVTSPAIVEEYVEGKTLEQVLRGGWLSGDERTPLDARQTALVAKGIVRALARLLDYDVVHRDLAPRNVMLRQRSIQDGLAHGAEVLLVDLGQSTNADSFVTPAWGRPRLATIAYGAPEVFGGEFYELRNRTSVDIWSLGALIVFMLTGERPWPVGLRTTPATDRGYLSEAVEAKRRCLDLKHYLGREYSSDAEWRLGQIVQACTAFDPGERPGVDDVDSALSGVIAQFPKTSGTTLRPTSGAAGANPQRSQASAASSSSNGWSVRIRPVASDTPVAAGREDQPALVASVGQGSPAGAPAVPVPETPAPAAPPAPGLVERLRQRVAGRKSEREERRRQEELERRRRDAERRQRRHPVIPGVEAQPVRFVLAVSPVKILWAIPRASGPRRLFSTVLTVSMALAILLLALSRSNGEILLRWVLVLGLLWVYVPWSHLAAATLGVGNYQARRGRWTHALASTILSLALGFLLVVIFQ